MLPGDIHHLVWCSDPQLSPDRSQVAYVVTRVDEAANRYRSQVWIVDADGQGLPRPVSAGEENDGSPRWAPDGRSLAFTTTRPKDSTGATPSSIHVLSTSGPGEASLVCEHDEGVAGVTYSPDGRWLAYTTRVRGDHYDSPDADRRPPRRIDRPLYRLNGEGTVLDRPTHVHVVPTDGSAGPRDLTPGDAEFASPAWFADSRALVCTRSDSSERLLGSDLVRIHLDDDSITVLTNGGGAYSEPAVSPEGDIAVVGYSDAEIFPQNSRMGVLGDDGEVEWWTDDSRDWNVFPIPTAPRWNRGRLEGLVSDRGRETLCSVGRDGDVEVVAGGEIWVTSWSSQNDTAAFVAEDPARPGEVYLLSDGIERRLTRVTDPFVARANPVMSQRFLAPSGDVEVDGWVYLPPDFDPAENYPMLLNIHGGPFTQYGDFFYDEAQHQARAGYVVVLSNPRGGSGRDNNWARAICGRALGGPGWGSVDFDDVMAIVDAALEQFPFIDSNRLGVIGGSYGGYMTSWTIGHTDRFAAACSERAVNNLGTLDLTSDIAGIAGYWFGVSPLEDPDEIRRMSPISYVDDMTTPLLIIHSDDDLRCPHEQADQLFYELKRRDRDVEYYLFNGENHELSRSGSPAHRVQRADLILEFFNRHLQPEN